MDRPESFEHQVAMRTHTKMLDENVMESSTRYVSCQADICHMHWLGEMHLQECCCPPDDMIATNFWAPYRFGTWPSSGPHGIVNIPCELFVAFFGRIPRSQGIWRFFMHIKQPAHEISESCRWALLALLIRWSYALN